MARRGIRFVATVEAPKRVPPTMREAKGKLGGLQAPATPGLREGLEGRANPADTTGLAAGPATNRP